MITTFVQAVTVFLAAYQNLASAACSPNHGLICPGPTRPGTEQTTVQQINAGLASANPAGSAAAVCIGPDDPYPNAGASLTWKAGDATVTGWRTQGTGFQISNADVGGKSCTCG